MNTIYRMIQSRPGFALLPLLAAIAFQLPALSQASASNDPPYYDEIRDSRGEIRPQYKKVYEIFKKLSEEQKTIASAQALQDFKGDNALNLLPRLLTQSEYHTLEKGIQQRATALKMFFEDHYSGRKSYASEGILPAQLVEQIARRHGDDAWEGKLNPEYLNWIYGPDIFRLSNGKFAVIEDNFGYVGGLGDLIQARKSLLNAVPDYRLHLEGPDPAQFYKNLVDRYKARSNPSGGKIVLLQYERAAWADNEDGRIGQIFKDLGVEIIYLPMHTPLKKGAKKLALQSDGVYVIKRGAKPERVGYIICNADILDVDGSSAEMKKRILLTHAKNRIEKLENRILKKKRPADAETEITRLRDLVLKSDYEGLYSLLESKSKDFGLNFLTGDFGVPGLLRAVNQGQVGMNYAPGLNFAEDKEFYTYVERLIRFYLKEEPVLETLETGSFRKFDSRGTPVLDEAALNQVFSNLDQYVIKGVAGMGGKEVWIGPKMGGPEIAALKESILGQPALFIFQKFHHLSVMEGYLVDLRILTDVGKKVGDVYVSKTPWGRAVPLDGDGKVNISANGSETTVSVVPDDPKNIRVGCETILSRPPPSAGLSLSP